MNKLILLLITLISLVYKTSIGQDMMTLETASYCDSNLINNLITHSRSQNNTDSAISILDRAKQCADKLSFPEFKIRVYIEYGVQLNLKGEHSLALTYLQSAFNLINIGGESYEPYLSRVHQNIGNTFDQLSMTDSALIHLYKAIEYGENNKTGHEMWRNYSALGRLYGKINYYDDGIEMLQKGIHSAQLTKDTFGLIASYQNIAVVYASKSNNTDLRKPEEYLLKARDLLDNYKNDRLRLSVLTTLSTIYGIYGDVKAQEKYLLESVQIKGIDVYQEFLALGNISNFYINESQPEKALYYIRMAEERYTHAGQKLQAGLKHKKALAYQSLKMYKEAAQLFCSYIMDMREIEFEEKSKKAGEIKAQYQINNKNKEFLMKEIEFRQQKLELQNKNFIAYVLSSGLLILIISLVIYFIHRHKKIKREEIELLEKASWKATLEGEENERKRIAKELHDNIGGNLSTIKLWLSNIQTQTHLEKNTSKDLREIESLLDNTLNDVRNSAHHMMPELLLRLGLTEAVRIYCLTIQKASDITIQFHYFGYISDIGKELELIIYRAVQELVQNIIKHSAASGAIVQISLHNDKLTVTIEDNGIGFNTQKLKKTGGIGISNTIKTIKYIGGKIDIQSEANNGTTIEIELLIHKNQLNNHRA